MHHRKNLSGYIFTTKARIDNRKKKLVKQQYVLHMSPQYGELRPICGWDRFTSLGHPCKFQHLSHLGSVTARQSSSERQPNFVALNRGCHLCSAGRPSRWALAHISSYCMHYNNNNPFNGPLSMKIMVSWYQKDIQSLTSCLCGYYTTSLINFLHVLLSMASSLHSCRVWESFFVTPLHVFFGLPLDLTPSTS